MIRGCHKKYDGQETTRRSEENADRAGSHQETSRRRVIVMESLRICLSLEGPSGIGSEGSAAGRNAAAEETEKDHRIRQLERWGEAK